MGANLLLVDDQPEVLEGLALAFGRTDHEAVTATSGEEAIHTLNSEDIDVVVTDLKMDGIDGMGVLRHALTLSPAPAVILLTAHRTIESAVDALKEGAFDYLTKPVNVKELRVLVDKATEHRRLVRENYELRQTLDKRFGIEGLVGESPEMSELYQTLRQVGPTRATVLIQGESGTGKELVARALHQASPRAKKDFVAVHCAALPETLLESELFGHERGAFTGAVARRPGRFEIASGGTLLLDEIGEIPLSMQVKLLRVLEQREIQRVGGNETVKTDVRLVCATNRDLEEEVAEGRFREDLYYRLKVVQVSVPPLRHRRSDIPLLATHFLKEFAKESGRPVPTLCKDSIEALQGYHWPGTVRELRNIMENSFVFLKGDTISAGDLPRAIRRGEAAPTEGLQIPLGLPLEEVETMYLKRTLASVDGNRTRASEILGISRRTLQRRIKELGIDGS